MNINQKISPSPSLPKRGTRLLFLILSILIFTISISYAYDIDPHYKFSGVKSPDSPLKNTWGAFQTDLFSGSFSYEYKIDVPPGTNGLTPQISIGYNSHSAKGKAGWAGAGWDIPLSYIQRNIQYTRKDISDDTFELYLDGAKHDLIFVGTLPADLSATPYVGLYKTKNETYLRIEFKAGAPNTKGNYWLVTAKDGTQYRFGYNLDSENLVNATDATVPQFVWRWGLDQLKDSNGNGIYFGYFEDRGSVYLDSITYNNDLKRAIQFVREAKPDASDAYLMIDQGSEVYDAYRLYEIQIFVSGAPVRKYRFSYVLNETQNKSLLTSITQYGADGISSLPPVKFEYAVSNNGFKDSVNWDTPGTGRMDIRTVDKALNDTDGDTFDVNGDGLPDIVRFDPTQAVHDNWDVWLNTGSGFSGNQLTWNVPKGWSIRNNDQLKCTNLGDSENQDPNTKTAPMDINGDGYIDFLKADGNGSDLEFRINDGNNFSSTTNSWTLLFNAYIRDVRNPCDGDAPNVQQTFFDINGDGLPDIVKKEKVGDFWYWHIWRNTINGFTDFGLWRVYQNVGEIEDFTRGTTTNTEVSHYDINGDGLVDIVIAYDYIWRIWLNTGSNFIDGGQWDTHNTSFDNINDTNNDGKVKRDLIDINGDSLPDIVDPVACSQPLCPWQVWYNTGKGFTAMQYWTVPTDVDPNGYITNLDDAGDTNRDVFDIDGDGAVDLVRVDGGIWKVYSNKAGQADLLSKVTDTLGGTVSINYNSSAKYSNTRLPFNYWVVNSITTNNGMVGPHALSSTTNYSYAQGLYDFPTREFRGFGQVSETRADDSKVIHYYYQDEAKKGKEYKAEVKSASDAPFASVQNAFSEVLSNGVYISNIIQTDEYTFDGTPANSKLKRKEYQNYDAFGNVGLLIDYGDWNSGGDDVYTYNEYWPSCSSAYIVDKLKHKYIKPSPTGSNLREGFYWYDNSTSCVSKGNLTKEENWLNTGTNPVTTHEYDSYGNRNKTTDSEGRVNRFEFDSTYYTFPVNTYNAKNQLITRSFNVVNGQVIQETDPNGFATTFVYDTFQRKIREVKPYDSDASPTTSIQYVLDGIPPESVIVYRKDGTPTFDTVQFVDGFGNLIQTKAEYESNMNKTVVDVFYDKMGRVKKQSNPHLTDSTLAYSSPDVAAPGTGYTYDPLGRPIQIQNPDGTQINRTFDHWTVNETDENGHAKSYAFDASQRLKQVVENNSGSSYVTNYVYSPLGELNTISDHLGNVTTIEYDSLGRKIQMNDPDMSTWMYAYDRFGNLVSQTDARGITTNITYDPLNRKTFIDYPGSADIQFTYDAGTIGTLSQVVDAAGTVNYYYDQRLRKSREDRTIDGNTFSTLWAYDSMDRATSQTYPDGQSVVFNYNAQGKLDNIPGVLTGIDYNAAGQVTQKSYASGKTTTFTYYAANQRLNKIATSGLQNFTYTYDNVGNINSIVDSISGKTENFSYDNLDRLTSAGDNSYSIQYQINAIGNMTSMVKDGRTTNFTYGSGSAIPHAVTGMTVPFPVVGSFIIDNGNAYTNTNVVTLNNVATGNPTYYMASEDKLFTNALWQTYSTAPTFLLSPGFGKKTVYFKVRNADGESSVKSDTIELRLNPEDVYKDDDEDGLSNYLEYIYGTNPNKKDTDADGISDYAEVFSGKSDPKNTDSDKDGINDLNDPYPKSAYHYSFSENYALRHTLNEGGDTRSSSTYKITDSLGNGFGKDVIRVQSHPAVSVTPSLIDFKTVTIGDSSMVSITLSNSGMGDLVIENISFNGVDSVEFSKQNDNCSGKTIAPSGTCTHDIIFSPTSTGPKSANLSITSNDPDENPLNVNLNGAGVDTTPPSGSIMINSGDTHTNSISVTLTISASDLSGVSQTCISNTTSCSSWEAYTTSKAWTLSSGDGTKTVYVWFKDSVDNENTTPYSDSIILDATAPTDGTLTATAGDAQVSLSWSGFSDATSGIGSYKLVYDTTGTPSSCSSGAQIYSGSGNSYTHSSRTNGTTYYYRVCAYDNVGNVSMGAIALATPEATDAQVDIYIAGNKKGSYSILPNYLVAPQYPGVMDGPVQVVSTNGAPVFASERSVYGGSFNEVMGYPGNQLTTEYWFPWYDQVYMSTWILVGNPDNSQTANVDIYIAGVQRGSYSIPPMGRVTPQYPGVMDGPVQVVSTIPVFASERALYGGSFNEVMGYPGNQLTTEYWFPWYDQVSMQTWILVGNPDDSQTANVDIYIGETKKGSYSIPPLGRVTPQYTGVMDGPVQVVSTIPIFASERALYGNSFNEVMGYPGNQLTTEYWFPWYDQLSMSSWILVGNPDDSQTAYVDIYIAGVQRGSYTIPPMGRVAPQYPGVIDGPVQVVSTIPVFASERALYGNSFNEVMGYPANQLTTEYWFPWYDQLSMSSWILVGNPNP